jgi:hypothetical protein
MTERARYWAAQLAAWEQSGLTQAEFCRRRRIKAGSFAWWKRQLLGPSRQRHKEPGKRTRPCAKSPTRRGRPAGSSDPPTGPVRLLRSSKLQERREQPTKSPRPAKRRARSAKLSASFVELPLASAFSAPTYELVLASGRAIRIPSQFDPEALARLISVVESC